MCTSEISKILIGNDGIILFDERIILCKNEYFSNLSKSHRQSLIRTIFPILTKTTRWGFFKKIKYTVEPCHKISPNKLDVKIEELAAENNWDDYPIVAIFMYKEGDKYLL